MSQSLAVAERPVRIPRLDELPENAKLVAARVTVMWLRTWEAAIDMGAPATLLDNPVREFETVFRAKDNPPRYVDVLLVSFGDRFMSSKRVREWGSRNNLKKFIHPRVVLALRDEMLALFGGHLTARGRVGVVSLEPSVLHDGDRRVCTLYYQYNKEKKIDASLILDRDCAGWSRDHYIGFDISGA